MTTQQLSKKRLTPAEVCKLGAEALRYYAAANGSAEKAYLDIEIENCVDIGCLAGFDSFDLNVAAFALTRLSEILNHGQ